MGKPSQYPHRSGFRKLQKTAFLNRQNIIGKYLEIRCQHKGIHWEMAPQPGEKSCHPFAVCLASCYPPFFDWHQATGSPIVRLPISLQHKSGPEWRGRPQQPSPGQDGSYPKLGIGQGPSETGKQNTEKQTRRAGRSRKAEGPATSLWLRFIFSIFLIVEQCSCTAKWVKLSLNLKHKS